MYLFQRLVYKSVDFCLLKVGLEYGEEVHKNQPKDKVILWRRLVCRTRWGNKPRKRKKEKKVSSWNSPEVEFLVRGFKIAQET